MARQPKENAPPDEELDEIIRNIADRLAAARKDRGLTQAALGAMADMTQQQVFGLEQGTSNVTIRTLARVAKVLDVDLNTLFSKIGASSSTRLVEALESFRTLLEERAEQERAFRREIGELIDRASANAIRREPEQKEGGDGCPSEAGACSGAIKKQ
ncbi:helix-turn-helix transcriptional regulator [Acidisoma cellulosilytica]|uniref:Helix-turn-helix transcriptional regulator n=1 Tax=Acidisoma cellulosilyticum TaxID=2802395 RepID=A0A964E618_9PROT|nr:helix-turn-helix transcriptional regulator [Acidisoma cellulosilyticum]MCB8883037.1 helix-turn-helix transcriptional regulator [Acidisoma cellulosilyticum]